MRVKFLTANELMARTASGRSFGRPTNADERAYWTCGYYHLFRLAEFGSLDGVRRDLGYTFAME